MDTLRTDLRFAIRGMRRTPLATVIAVSTLALGIGANTAIFSVVRGVLLMPLPYANPEAIVRVWPDQPFSKEMATAFRDQAGAFSAFSIFGSGTAVLRTPDGPEEWPVTSALGGHLAVLAATPLRGRGLRVDDELPGAPPVAIIAHELWQGRFGGADDIIGRRVELDGAPTEIVGVLPVAFRPLVTGTAVWRPLRLDPSNLDDFRDMMAYSAIARLDLGVSQQAAQTEVRAIAARLRAELPDYHGEERVRTASVTPLKERIVGPVRAPLTVLFGAAGLVLLIACANVATLLFARGAQRSGEMATRTALGATQRRLIRQQLTESTLLAAVGGIAGATIAWWLGSALIALLPSTLPRLDNVRVAPLELAFAMASALVAVAVAGLVPAWRAARRSLTQSAGREHVGPERSSGNFLVAVEVALAVILVVGSGLMLKSLWRLGRVDPGFKTDGSLVLRLRLPTPFESDEARRSELRRALDAVRAVPGAQKAALIDLLPMSGGHRGLAFSTPDHVTPAGEPPRSAGYRVVSAGYFETMGIPLLSGRHFEAADRAGGIAVGVVNETLAQQLWPAGQAVDKELRWPDGSPWLRIVGVVGDVRQASLDQPPRATIYQSVEQANDLGQLLDAAFLVIRTDGAPSALAGAAGRSLRNALPEATVSQVRPLAEVVGASADRSRFMARLLTAFGALAVFLAAVGLYGVGSNAVACRVREIGVRIALGAGRSAVLRSVLAREASAVALGALVGLVIAVSTGQLLESQLFAVRPLDIGVLLASVATISGAALAAVLLPARRATRVDPMVALRDS